MAVSVSYDMTRDRLRVSAYPSRIRMYLASLLCVTHAVRAPQRFGVRPSMRIVDVSEITRYVKDLLEEDYNLQDVWVRGEVTNYTQSAAGHRYFSLKDEFAALRCVLFRGASSSIPPMRNGMAVLAHGRMSIYEQRGDYQFYVDAVEEAGIGELHLRFEELKARLDAEGLFAPERKRPLPPLPATIGIVTSPTAAALRDILRTLRLRCPLVRVILAPTLVQGESAAQQIAEALDALNAQGDSDVIVLARGGGSLEELWAFNEEVVARAVARSRIPVVTGVGHETDFTIADFVADLRASTPTAAATAVVPDASDWRETLQATQERLAYLIADQVESQRQHLAVARHQLERASPWQRIAEARQQVDEALQSMRVQTEHRVALRHEQLRGATLRLHALSPLLTIGRGFAVVRRGTNGSSVTSVAQVAPGDGLTIQIADGVIAATADHSVRGDAAHALHPLADATIPSERATTTDAQPTPNKEHRS